MKSSRIHKLVIKKQKNIQTYQIRLFSLSVALSKDPLPYHYMLALGYHTECMVSTYQVLPLCWLLSLSEMGLKSQPLSTIHYNL